ncbi:TonB-dependent receptor [Acetobacter tropicalis]|nr:TonB-dependent receptor [Acetobacter tropicalis]
MLLQQPIFTFRMPCFLQKQALLASSVLFFTLSSHAWGQTGSLTSSSTPLPLKKQSVKKPLPVSQPKPAQNVTAREAEEVLVTSERRTESPQNIGSSLSVIGGKTLQTRNVNNVFDLQYLTPSLQVTPQFGSGQPAFAIRGIGFNDYASNNAPTVGVYVDEVANPVPFATNGMMFDISRVEVLRGPQGTLYGRNTTGGAINYILNKPTSTFHTGGGVQYGRFDSAKIDGYISGPITDKLRYRLSGETQQGGDWQRNSAGLGLGRVNRGAARLLLDYEASDTLKFEFNLHGSRDRSDANGLHLYSPMSAFNALNASAPVYAVSSDRYQTNWGTSPEFAKQLGINANTKPFSHIDVGGVSFRAEKKLPFATITDLLSYDNMQRQEYMNFDAWQGNLADVAFKTRANVLANELRLTSPNKQRLTWVGGIYYAHQYMNDRYQSGFADLYGFDRDLRYSQFVNTISGFGQATYHVTDKLRFTGGFRIEHESRKLSNMASYQIVNSAITNPGNVLRSQSTDFTLPSGKFEVQYNPIRNNMLYASFTRGIKSGGFTTYNSNAVGVSSAPFKPESLLAYEVGNKFSLPEQHLRLNVAGFYYDYSNQQIQSATLNQETGLVGSIVNAPRSHMYGGEIEAEWHPLPGLTLSQSAGFAVGAFDRFSSLYSAHVVNGLYVGDYRNRKGESLPFPKITVNGSVSYNWSIGDYFLTTGMDYSLRSTYHSLFGTRYNVAGYTLWGANIGFGPKDGKWSVAAFGKNIFDKKYDVERNYFVDGANIALAGMPATWGVRLSVNY